MIILQITLAIVLARGLSTLYFLLNSINWQKKASSESKLSKNSKTKFYILIPVLREQKRIIATLEYFVKHFRRENIKIIVITTQKEFSKKFNGESTQKLVESFIKNNKYSGYIKVINYPDAKGKMAHQLNYAIDKIKEDSYIAIYNADSRPHFNTFDYVSRSVQKNESEIFQQPAVFTKNYNDLNPFLKISAILQSRWTFAHEIARLLRQSISNNVFFRKYAYAHVVGHGLIIKKSVLESVGKFPTGTMTEDLFLGFLLRSKRYRIFAIPFLEYADSPETVRGSWNQKYIWFWGPMKNISYLQYVAKNKKQLGIESLISPLLFTLEGLLSALAWLISGPLVLMLLASPLITTDLILITISYLVIFIYGPLQYLIFFWNYNNKNYLEMVYILLLSVPVIIFNSIPPYLSIFNELRSKIDKSEIHKPKTDD